jgi:hypothetical protein
MNKRLRSIVLLVLIAATASAQVPGARVHVRPAGRTAAAGYADPPLEVAREFRALLLAHARQIAVTAPPRQTLVAAWLIAQTNEGETESTALLQNAMTAGVADPMVWWMLLDICASAPERCDAMRDRIRLRLIDLEPGNAAVFLRILGTTDWRNDPTTARLYLARAAAAPAFDQHEREWAAELRTFYAAVAIPKSHEGMYVRGVGPEVARYSQLLGMMSMVGAPSLGTGQQCGEGLDRSMLETAAADCRAAYAKLATSTVATTRYLGLAKSLRLAAGSKAQAEWSRRLLRHLWLQSRGELRLALDTDEKIVAVFDDRVRNGEVASFEHVLQRAGVALDPPAGWMPERIEPELRALLRVD